MIAFTIGQNQALADHLKWCQELLDENERSLELFSSGKMRIGDGPRDITTEWIETLNRHNESLRRVLKALEPAKMQSQVRS
jgi:hypothetical protein